MKTICCIIGYASLLMQWHGCSKLDGTWSISSQTNFVGQLDCFHCSEAVFCTGYKSWQFMLDLLPSDRVALSTVDITGVLEHARRNML